MIDSHGRPRDALEEKAETPEQLALAEIVCSVAGNS